MSFYIDPISSRMVTTNSKSLDNLRIHDVVEVNQFAGTFLVGKVKVMDLLPFVDVPSRPTDLKRKEFSNWLQHSCRTTVASGVSPSEWQRMIKLKRAQELIPRSVRDHKTNLIEAIVLAQVGGQVTYDKRLKVLDIAMNLTKCRLHKTAHFSNRCADPTCPEHSGASASPLAVLDGQHRLIAAHSLITDPAFRGEWDFNTEIAFTLILSDNEKEPHSFKEKDRALQFTFLNTKREALDPFHTLYLNRFFIWDPSIDADKIDVYDTFVEYSTRNDFVRLDPDHGQKPIQFDLKETSFEQCADGLGAGFSYVERKMGVAGAKTPLTVNQKSSLLENYVLALTNLFARKTADPLEIPRILTALLEDFKNVVKYLTVGISLPSVADLEVAVSKTDVNLVGPELCSYSQFRGEKKLFPKILNDIHSSGASWKSFIWTKYRLRSTPSSFQEFWKSEAGDLSNWELDYGCNCPSLSIPTTMTPGVRLSVNPVCPSCRKANYPKLKFEVAANTLDLTVKRGISGRIKPVLVQNLSIAQGNTYIPLTFGTGVTHPASGDTIEVEVECRNLAREGVRDQFYIHIL